MRVGQVVKFFGADDLYWSKLIHGELAFVHCIEGDMQLIPLDANGRDIEDWIRLRCPGWVHKSDSIPLPDDLPEDIQAKVLLALLR